MNERTITLTSLAAWSCWIIGTGMSIWDAFVAIDLLGLAAGFYAGGICLTLRSTVARKAMSMSSAFELGREAERRQGPRSV